MTLASPLAEALQDRFELERELGRGGMATVYLVHDRKLDRAVALKVLRSDAAATLGPERFLREIRFTAHLQHPHILPVFEAGETEGRLWYTMPYVEGESLRERLRREGHLPIPEAVRIAREVADALDHSHRHGVIHRDIKPENILFEEGHALLADFGIAWALDAVADERLTEGGLVLGTPVYMSPEQGAAGSPVDGRSDLYALGCVVYEMLAGTPPFTGPSAQAILARHAVDPVPPLHTVRPSVPRHVEDAIGVALAKVPADRFATCGEFAQALMGEHGPARLGRQPSPRRRLRVVAGVIAAVAVIIVLGVNARQSTVDRRGAPAALGAGEPPRIAVLYFDDLTTDSSLRRFADRLTEDLIHEFSGVKGLRVISREGVQTFRGTRVPFDSMVAALRVNAVVDGSVEREGGLVRVTAQLVDPGSNTYLHSMSLERPLSHDVPPERSIAQELAAELRRQLGREVRLRSASLGAGSSLARALALKAQRARENASILADQPHPEDARIARQTLQSADSLLALAQSADPHWLRPLIDRGWVALDRARLLPGAERLAEIEEGLRLAEDAVQRAPESAEALELRGTVRGQLPTELEGPSGEPDRLRRAEADLRAALDRDSTSARTWATLSYVLWFKGSTAEAGLAARRALQEDTYLDEAPGILNELFFDNLMLGEFEAAAEWCQRGRAMFPGRWRFVECELTLMRHNSSVKPDPDSAWALVKLLDRLDPPEKAKAVGRQYHTIYRRVVAATISARAGRHDVARVELTRARRVTAGDSTLRVDLAYDEAYLRLVLGERQRAADLIQKYIEARPTARDYLARDPLLKDLHLSR